MSFLYHHPEKEARTQIHSLVSPSGFKTMTTGVRTGVVAGARVAVVGANYLVAATIVLPLDDVLLAGEPMGHRVAMPRPAGRH